MKKFADIVEDVKNLSIEEKEDLHSFLVRILADERRKEILQNHHATLDELKSGETKFYSTPDDLLKMLNEE